MNIEIRVRTQSLPRELQHLLTDTLDVFFRGIVNLSGWDWFRCAEAHADTGRPGLNCRFWDLECERMQGGGFRFWGGVTSVEVPGSISADAPSSFRAFMRTAPSAAWDEAQTR